MKMPIMLARAAVRSELLFELDDQTAGAEDVGIARAALVARQRALARAARDEKSVVGPTVVAACSERARRVSVAPVRVENQLDVLPLKNAKPWTFFGRLEAHHRLEPSNGSRQICECDVNVCKLHCRTLCKRSITRCLWSQRSEHTARGRLERQSRQRLE